MGLPNAEVYPDVSFLATETKKGAASAKGTRSRPTLGVNLRNFHLENLESVAAAVLSMYRQGWDIALICAEQFEDESLLTEFRRYMVRGLGGEAEGRVRLLPFASLQGTIDEISHVDIMMAMRLHVGLVAAQMGIPTLFLCYDDKVRAVAEQLGMEDYALTLSQCDEALLLKKLRALRENHAQISSVLQQHCQVLRSQAMEGYHKLNDILAGLS